MSSALYFVTSSKEGWIHMVGGLIGASLGVACAAIAIAWNVRAVRRLGEPQPLGAVLGVARHGIERRIYARGASIAFPVYALFVMLYLLSAGAPTTAGILASGAGIIYGSASAWVGRRWGRC